MLVEEDELPAVVVVPAVVVAPAALSLVLAALSAQMVAVVAESASKAYKELLRNRFERAMALLAFPLIALFASSAPSTASSQPASSQSTLVPALELDSLISAAVAASLSTLLVMTAGDLHLMISVPVLSPLLSAVLCVPAASLLRQRLWQRVLALARAPSSCHLSVQSSSPPRQRSCLAASKVVLYPSPH